MERQDLSELKQSIQHLEQNLFERLAAIESDVSLLARAAGKRRLNPEYLGIDEAARLAGRSKQGIQCLLKRELAKPDGFAIRRIHGAIHRQDLMRFLEHLARGHTGRGARVRAALEGI